MRHGCAECRAKARERRVLRQYLRGLTKAAMAFSAALDAEMKKPSDETRGKRVARLLNELDIATDATCRYALNMGWKGIASARAKFLPKNN